LPAADASVYLLDGRAPELLAFAAARPAHVPLIAIGPDPLVDAAPTAWLPAPTPAMLNALLAQLIEARPRTPGPSWRRKSDMIMGSSRQAQQLFHSLDQLAPAQTPVLISGESGTGKELVARALHFSGPRAAHPFIAINCAAIAEQLFESELFGHQRGAFTGAVAAHVGAIEAAHDGTLFLDEIGELPPSMQTKLLRVLETSEVQRVGSTELRKVNFRLVSATNRDLEREVAEGRFREDLFYRIHVYPLHVSPLRERPEDIPAIVTHHLSAIARRENRPSLRLTPGALERLLAYRWPGNVRELVNVLERAVVMANHREIDAEHVAFGRVASAQGTTPIAYRDAKQKFEREYYAQLMRTAGGNVSLAAKLGHKTRKEIYDALKRFDLKPRD
jgi:DNA-binding NtrC family response regulator